MVGRSHDHCGVGVDLFEECGGERDCRCRVAFEGFGEDVGLRDIGELLADEGEVVLECDDDDPLWWAEWQEPLVGELEHCLSNPDYVEELFRHGGSAEGPESRASPAGEDDAVDVWHGCVVK